MSRKKSQQRIELERGGHDRLLPKDFMEILTRRFFPVLSLTYISSVIGIAVQKGSIILYVFEDKTAYVMALPVVLWVSVPAILWIFLKGLPEYGHTADIWYKITAGIMTLTMMISFILFPEINMYGLRLYFVASLPVLVVMYLFFVKGGLPGFLAHPLTAMGLALLIYGATVNFLIEPDLLYSRAASLAGR